MPFIKLVKLVLKKGNKLFKLIKEGNEINIKKYTIKEKPIKISLHLPITFISFLIPNNETITRIIKIKKGGVL